MPEDAPPTHALSPQEQILQVVNNYWRACGVGAAAQLELADHLARGPMHVADLARRTQTHAESLYRLLRALECTGIFAQVSPRIFANTPASECLRRDVPGSQWAWIRVTLCADGFISGGWRGLMHALREGKPGFERLHGQTGWEHLQSNPQQATIFNQAMRDLSASIMLAVTASFAWSQFPVIADIGGGVGAQLMNILDANPSCRGILFDQPSVVAEAPDHPRMERVGGDFFLAIAVKADAYVLRWIIHDWSDEQAAAILKNIGRSCKRDARLILLESVVPEIAEFDLGKWMDVNMLVMAGGRERTASEFRELYAKAGFELEQIVPTSSPLSIIVGRPLA